MFILLDCYCLTRMSWKLKTCSLARNLLYRFFFLNIRIPEKLESELCRDATPPERKQWRVFSNRWVLGFSAYLFSQCEVGVGSSLLGLKQWTLSSLSVSWSICLDYRIGVRQTSASETYQGSYLGLYLSWIRWMQNTNISPSVEAPRVPIVLCLLMFFNQNWKYHLRNKFLGQFKWS